ncbi:protein Mis18-beta-like [Arapaima gigas]
MAHERYGKMRGCAAAADAEVTECSELMSTILSGAGLPPKPDYQKAAVLLCAVCSAVWSDSQEVCGEHARLNSVVCFRVTKNVVVKEELEFRLEGRLAGCTYKALHCSGCQCLVGVVLLSTPEHLSALRSLFLLQKENINCYLLKSSAVVKASTISFESNNIGTNLNKLKQEMDKIAARISQVEKKLKGGKNYKDG